MTARRLCLLLALWLLAACGAAPGTINQPVASSSAPIATAWSDGPPPSASAAAMLPTATPMIAPTIAATSAADAPGGQIAYVDDGDIWLLDLATNQTQQVTRDGFSSDPAWSPDGQRLAFTRGQSDTTQSVSVRADGSDPQTIGDSGALFPAFGPDGDLFVVRRVPGELPELQIVRHGSGGESIVHSEPGGLCGPIDLSAGPDQHLALSLNCGRGSYTLITSPGVTETIDLGRQIDGAVCAAPGVWSHDGGRIAAITARECAYQQETAITIVDDPLGRPRATTIVRDGGIFSLDWSPDDRWIVYAQNERGLFVIPASGGAPRPIAARGSSPAWRPATR